MTPSTESFAELVPCDLLDRSGEVFYSGRAAFSTPSDVYLLGYNPGSDPSDQRLRTVRSSIDEVNGKPERFSLYYEAWEEGRDPKMQQGIRHMFDRMDVTRPPDVALSRDRNSVSMLPQRHVPTGFATCEVGLIAHPAHEAHRNDSGVMLRRDPTQPRRESLSYDGRELIPDASQSLPSIQMHD